MSVTFTTQSTADRQFKYRKRKSVKTLNYIRVDPDSYGSPSGRTYSKTKRLITLNTTCVILMLMSHRRTQHISTNPGHLYAVQYCKKV